MKQNSQQLFSRASSFGLFVFFVVFFWGGRGGVVQKKTSSSLQMMVMRSIQVLNMCTLDNFYENQNHSDSELFWICELIGKKAAHWTICMCSTLSPIRFCLAFINCFRLTIAALLSLKTARQLHEYFILLKPFEKWGLNRNAIAGLSGDLSCCTLATFACMYWMLEIILHNTCCHIACRHVPRFHRFAKLVLGCSKLELYKRKLDGRNTLNSCHHSPVQHHVWRLP